MLSLIPTYKDEPSTHGRCNSTGIAGGGCCTWLLHIKQKYCIHQHAFLCSNIQHSTFHQLAKTGLSIVWKSKISYSYGLTANDDKTLSSFPLSPERETFRKLSFNTASDCLPFYKRLFHTPLQSPWVLHNPMSPGSYRPENDNTILTDL